MKCMPKLTLQYMLAMRRDNSCTRVLVTLWHVITLVEQIGTATCGEGPGHYTYHVVYDNRKFLGMCVSVLRAYTFVWSVCDVRIFIVYVSHCYGFFLDKGSMATKHWPSMPHTLSLPHTTLYTWSGETSGWVSVQFVSVGLFVLSLSLPMSSLRLSLSLSMSSLRGCACAVSRRT